MDSFEGVRICYLADKHDLYDDRIYWKMAVPLRRLGADVHYFLIGPSEEEGTTDEGITYRMWKVRSYSGNPYLNFVLKRLNPLNNYRILLKEASDLRADIYHFHDLWLNRIAPRLKSLPHRPAVFYDAREPYAEDYRSFYGSGGLGKFLVSAFSGWVDRWEKSRSRSYDRVIANEPVVREKFVPHVGQDRAVVIYNYTDLDRLQPSLKKQYDLIYCGLLTEPRGAFALLEALRIARERKPDIRALVLGRIDPPSLQERMMGYIREENLEDSIELRPQVPHEEIGSYYRRCKIGLILWKPLTSLKIKMPIKLFEYMAYGLPVIGSDFGHIREYVDREKCGITVDPEEPGEVAEAIVLLLSEKELYRAMSANGARASQKKYRWDKELDRLCDFYKKALDERRDSKT